MAQSKRKAGDRMMTRKNQVDDLLTRFERKSITQKKCPYCAPNHSKDLFSSDGSDYFISVSIRMSKMHLAVLSWDGGYSGNLPINYCPVCGRKL